MLREHGGHESLALAEYDKPASQGRSAQANETCGPPLSPNSKALDEFQKRGGKAGMRTVEFEKNQQIQQLRQA